MLIILLCMKLNAIFALMILDTYIKRYYLIFTYRKMKQPKNWDGRKRCTGNFVLQAAFEPDIKDTLTT